MKKEVKNLLEKYVTVKKIKIEGDHCIAYIEETVLGCSLFNALKKYSYSIWYSEFYKCMVITLLKK